MTVLEGKAVVITGAGRGLGRAYALHAAGCGAAVVVNDVRGELADEVVAEIGAAGGTAVASHHSVADPDQASALVAQCADRFGAIDGLVNNAGINYHLPPWADEPGRARAVIEVNVLGTFYCGIAAAKLMCGRGGVIVNVASGSMLGMSHGAAYSASKGAVASMTASWAVDLAEHGVRVNAICPLAWTPMMREDPKADIRAGGAGRTPDRIAPLVTYLLSDLSADIAGQLIRFLGDKLMIVGQHAFRAPVLDRDRWDVTDIADAFDGELAGALETPPRVRWVLPEPDGA